MNRKEIRDDIKSSFGLDVDKEDGNLSDSWFNTAIHDAIKIFIGTVAKSSRLTGGFHPLSVATSADT